MYWKATVEKPDGSGGWLTVGVFGTDDSPTGTGRHLHGDTALDAAKLLLSHVWPVDLSAPGRYENNPHRWADDRQAKTGIADHRITIEPSERKWDIPYGKTRPEPATFTVAELRLADVRQMVAESVTASAQAAELVKQAREARRNAQHAKWRVEQAVKEASSAGVDPAELGKAKRTVRKRKTS